MTEMQTNSMHHQSIKEPASRLRVDGYAEDEDDSYEELDTSSDKISYGDDKSGKSDVEELKLFDVEDDK